MHFISDSDKYMCVKKQYQQTKSYIIELTSSCSFSASTGCDLFSVRFDVCFLFGFLSGFRVSFYAPERQLPCT